MSKFLLAIGCLFVWQTKIYTQEKAANQPIPGAIIVMLESGADVKNVWTDLNARKNTFNQITNIAPLGSVHPLFLFEFDPTQTDAARLRSVIQQHPQVRAAQMDYWVESRQTPNDPNFDLQWGLSRIGVPEVWNYTTGGLTARGDTIVVAIIDDGFDVDHEDLKNNIWRNRFEIPNDGLDNDSNGYVDDMLGWSFDNNSNQHPKSSHGTSVTGILGAQGNNDLGVTGVNWALKIMVLSTQRVSNIVKAYEYVIEQRKRYNETDGAQGAFVVATNASFGQERRFCSEQPVWGAMYDLLGEVGILTGAGTVNRQLDVDAEGDMPTTCESDFIITCLNVTKEDRIGSSSGFGQVSIDLGAPGDGSYSTKAFNNYGGFNSNSAAAPHLTGAIALLYSLPCPALAENALANPTQTALIVRDAILKGVEPLVDLTNRTATGGMLNVFGSLEQLQSQCEVKNGDLQIVKLFPNPARAEVFVEYETPDFESYQIRIFNAMGQLMYEKDVTPPRFSIKRERVPVANWTSGLYVAVIEQGKQRVYQKFIIQ